MSESDNSRRKLIEAYLDDLKCKGFSVSDLIFELLKNEKDIDTCLSNALENLLNNNETNYELEYYKTAELIFQLKDKNKLASFRRVIRILYVIHKKEYTNLEEFFLIIHKKVNFPKTFTARIFLLGHDYGYLYSGLRLIIDKYDDKISEEKWVDGNYETRFSILEEVESLLYQDIVKYANNRK